jgi:heterodisulfide reductase subunit A-like polyferredoxin
LYNYNIFHLSTHIHSYSPIETIEVDVLVIGGGIQGLLALYELQAQMPHLNAILVTEGELGSGQTLSGQGYLHSGYSFAAHEPVVSNIKKSCSYWIKLMKVSHYYTLIDVRTALELFLKFLANFLMP